MVFLFLGETPKQLAAGRPARKRRDSMGQPYEAFESDLEPTCDICRLRLPSVRDVSLLHAPEVCRDFDQVVSYPGLYREPVHGCHAAAITGVKLRYELREFVKCAFGHRHKYGAIVELLCGFTVLMGHQCADHMVCNWKHLAREFARLDVFADNKAILLDAEETVEAATDVVRETERLTSTANSLKGDRFGALGEKLLSLPGGEVHHPWTGNYLGRVAGLDLLRPPPTTGPRTSLREVREAVARIPTPNAEEAALLAGKLRDVESMASLLRNWIGLANTFFSPNNLALALVATGLEHRLKIHGTRLVSTDGKTLWLAGADGVHQEDKHADRV
jgi:hypothetical protein